MGKFGFIGAFIISLLVGYCWFGIVMASLFNNLLSSTAYALGSVVGWAIVFIIGILMSFFIVVGLIFLCIVGGAE